MDIRYSRGLDEMYLSRWISDPRLKDSLPCQTATENKNFVKSWMYYTSLKAGLSCVIQDVNVAMGVFILMPYIKVQHHALLQIIVNPDFARRGIGSSLLKNMLHLAKNYLNLECVFIEFIGPLEHLEFLKKRGFRVYAVQKGYVEGPFSDRYLLEMVLV